MAHVVSRKAQTNKKKMNGSLNRNFVTKAGKPFKDVSAFMKEHKTKPMSLLYGASGLIRRGQLNDAQRVINHALDIMDSQEQIPNKRSIIDHALEIINKADLSDQTLTIKRAILITGIEVCKGSDREELTHLLNQLYKDAPHIRKFYEIGENNETLSLDRLR